MEAVGRKGVWLLKGVADEHPPAGVASQTEKALSVVYRPFSASRRCSAKNTWLSAGSLAKACSSSQLWETTKKKLFRDCTCKPK